MRLLPPPVDSGLAIHHPVMAPACRLLVTWLALGVSDYANASDLWEGTLGQATVVVALDDTQVDADGRYFYRRHRLDLDLRVSEGHARVWAEYAGGGDTATARWVMDRPPVAIGTAWTGTWIGTDGHRLPIRLQPLMVSPTAGDDANAAIPDIDDYGHARLDGLRLEPSRTEARDGYRLQWLREPTTGFEIFEFSSGFSDPARARINRALHASLWQAVKGRFECLSAAHAREYSFKATLRYLASDAVSLSRYTRYDCGGAHPDAGDDPLTLDARSGGPLALEDVFFVAGGALSKPPVDDEERESDQFYDYREKTFAPTVLTLLGTLHPRQMARPRGEGECDYSQASIWSTPIWYLLPDGLYLGPSMSGAERACEEPAFAVLPWSLVRKHPGRVQLGP